MCFQSSSVGLCSAAEQPAAGKLEGTQVQHPTLCLVPVGPCTLYPVPLVYLSTLYPLRVALYPVPSFTLRHPSGSPLYLVPCTLYLVPCTLVPCTLEPVDLLPSTFYLGPWILANLVPCTWFFSTVVTRYQCLQSWTPLGPTTSSLPDSSSLLHPRACRGPRRMPPSWTPLSPSCKPTPSLAPLQLPSQPDLPQTHSPQETELRDVPPRAFLSRLEHWQRPLGAKLSPQTATDGRRGYQ